MITFAEYWPNNLLLINTSQILVAYEVLSFIAAREDLHGKRDWASFSLRLEGGELLQ